MGRAGGSVLTGVRCHALSLSLILISISAHTTTLSSTPTTPTTPPKTTYPKQQQVLWLPPTTGGCVTSFSVNAKDVSSGATVASKTSDKELKATFEGLSSGATYEFYVTPNGPKGSGGGLGAKAAMPPSQLDETPEGPEALASAATSDTSARLTWSPPAGNPKVDSYSIKIIPVNATGYPLSGARNLTAKASGGAKAVTLKGLKPGAYYIFAVSAVSDSKGSSPEPSIYFQRMPREGEQAPSAPGGLRAGPAGQQGAVALTWGAPGGTEPDFYQVGITEVDGSGKALSATNVVPNKNTTAIIKDLNPGSTYRVRSVCFVLCCVCGSERGDETRRRERVCVCEKRRTI